LKEKRTSIYIAHRRIHRKASCQAGGLVVKPPLMHSRHWTRAAGQPGHRPQPAHTGLCGEPDRWPTTPVTSRSWM